MGEMEVDVEVEDEGIMMFCFCLLRLLVGAVGLLLVVVCCHASGDGWHERRYFLWFLIDFSRGCFLQRPLKNGGGIKTKLLSDRKDWGIQKRFE